MRLSEKRGEVVALVGTKAWAKQQLRANGIRLIARDKGMIRLQNSKTRSLYRELELRGLLTK